MEKPHSEEETLWEYPVTQEQPVRRITRAYACSLSNLPIFQYLSPTTKRKQRVYHINEETSEAPSLEDIVLDYLQSINSPWEEIPEDSPSEGNPSSDWENPSKETLNQNIPILDMTNIPQSGGNQLPPPLGELPPWLAQDAMAIPGKQHFLPKNVEKVLPKFYPEWGDTVENHINSFFLAMHMLGVADEDIVCRLFPFTLIGATSTWYFSLRIGSTTSWATFQQAFLDKYGDDKTLVALVLELSLLNMKTKEKVKDFNI